MSLPLSVTRVPASAEALLAGVVDYAGLFPPATLDMNAATAEYASALAGADAWMLGRFVLPAGRLADLAHARALASSVSEWRLSAIVTAGADPDMASIAACNASAGRPLARVDAIECQPPSIEGIDWLAQRAAGQFDVYVEIPATGEPSAWLDRIAARGLRAKIRTGGTTAEAFPSPGAVIAFLAAALGAGVPFKATAGLHHAVGGAYRLTYEAGAAEARMYGYLNVLLATAALQMRLPAQVAENVLRCTHASAFVFSDTGIRWEDFEFPNDLLRRLRATHLVSFGSCSFREPVGELTALVTAPR